MMRLNLKHPSSEGDVSYSVNANGVSDIYASDGGWYVERSNGSVRTWFPNWKVEEVFEQRETSAKPENGLPEYAEPSTVGFKCRECKQEFPKLQGLKTHYGMAHRQQD